MRVRTPAYEGPGASGLEESLESHLRGAENGEPGIWSVLSRPPVVPPLVPLVDTKRSN